MAPKNRQNEAFAAALDRLLPTRRPPAWTKEKEDYYGSWHLPIGAISTVVAVWDVASTREWLLYCARQGEWRTNGAATRSLPEPLEGIIEPSEWLALQALIYGS